MSAEDKRKNCITCNKSMKRVNWYYRNGGYYCNKTCFAKHVEKKAQEKPAE